VKRGEWDVKTSGTAHPQGLVALVGDGIPLRLDDDDTDPAHVFETLTTVQQMVLMARLKAWVEYLENSDVCSESLR
jgi:hypothetical protein